MSFVLPERIIHNAFLAAVGLANEDFERFKDDETQTLLYRLFALDSLDKPLQNGNFNWFEQSKNLLLRNYGYARRLQFTFGYNMERQGLPTVHIILPSDRPGQGTGLGYGEGYLPDEIFIYKEKQYVRKILTANFDATYQCLITSDNAYEVMVLYQYFRAMMISMHTHLAISGFMNLEMSGADLTFNGENVPQNIFHRSINFHFDYEVRVPSYNLDEVIENLIFQGRAILSSDESN